MIVFIQMPGHAYTHRDLVHLTHQAPRRRGWTFGTAKSDIDQSLRAHARFAVKIRDYEWLIRQRSLPPAVYVFTDRERMDVWQLRVFSGLFRHINALGPGYRAINDPARMCDRVSLLRTLHTRGLNPFDVYRLDELPDNITFPVFVRRAFDHGFPFDDLLHSRAALDAVIQRLQAGGEPAAGVIVTEFCGAPVDERSGLYRKLAAYRIDDEVFFFNTGHEPNWNVKYGKHASAPAELYTEEQAFIENNAFQTEVAGVFEAGGIHYGRLDFGLVAGKPVFYEINTNPHISLKPQAHPNPIRQKNIEAGLIKYLEALSKLEDTTERSPRTLAKRGVRVFNHPYIQQRWVRGVGMFNRRLWRP